jgi:putative metal-binding protein
MLRLTVAVASVVALLAFPSAAVAADDFAAAGDLTPDVEIADDNTGYDTEPNEVLVCHQDGFDRPYGATAWYRFQAQRTGFHVAATFGSDIDTVLSVYRPRSGGGIPQAADRRGCQDDADENDADSFVGFDAVQGNVYYVQVGGFDGAADPPDQGEIVVAVFQPPANDFRANAQPIGVGGFQGYNFNAREEAGEPTNCAGANYSSTTWYRATAPAVGDAKVTVTSSDMDPVVAVFPPGSNTPIACNDDGPGETRTASVSGRVSPGDYFIQVGGYEGEEGTYEIRLEFTADNDLDDDGSLQGQDCDDGNAGIKPGAPEQVNNDVDENCDGVKEFDRDGDGSRVPGSPGDCDDGNAARSPLKPEVPGNGVDENCDNIVTPYDLIPSRVVSAWDLGRVTRMRELVLSNARRGSTVTLRCRKGCKLKTKRISIRRDARQMKLQNRLTKRQRRFGPKAKLTITLSGPGWSPKVTIYSMRPGKVPRRQELCYADRREC